MRYVFTQEERSRQFSGKLKTKTHILELEKEEASEYGRTCSLDLKCITRNFPDELMESNVEGSKTVNKLPVYRFQPSLLRLKAH